MAKRKRSSAYRQYVNNHPAKLAAVGLQCSKAGQMPSFVEPCLASPAEQIPDGEKWVHEIKFDGYRFQLRRDGTDIRFLTRRGHDWTDRVGALKDAAQKLDCGTCLLDGEVIVPTDTGLSDFGALESDLGSGRSNRLVFYVFDVLFLDGLDLRGCPLSERRQVLGILMKGLKGPIQLSETIDEGGTKLFKQACQMHLEGIVSKRLDSRYSSGRSHNWSKVLCRKRDTFVIAGIAYDKKKFDGIYLARKKGRSLEYAGKVEHGFSEGATARLTQRAQKLIAAKPPLKIKKPKAVWLKPKLLAEVEYRALTGDGKLRHPSYKGLREDL